MIPLFDSLPMRLSRSVALLLAGLSAIALVLLPTPAIAAPLSARVSPPLLALFHFSGSRPTALGVRQGRLQPCPSSPNCVNSQSPDGEPAIAPLPLGKNPEQTFQHLKAVIESMPRTQVIQATDTYLYAEFTSALMGFVDDVEFYLDQPAGVIQVRSASRLGESDLGVNRQRIEAIRSQLVNPA